MKTIKPAGRRKVVKLLSAGGAVASGVANSVRNPARGPEKKSADATQKNALTPARQGFFETGNREGLEGKWGAAGLGMWKTQFPVVALAMRSGRKRETDA